MTSKATENRLQRLERSHAHQAAPWQIIELRQCADDPELWTDGVHVGTRDEMQARQPEHSIMVHLTTFAYDGQRHELRTDDAGRAVFSYDDAIRAIAPDA